MAEYFTQWAMTLNTSQEEANWIEERLRAWTTLSDVSASEIQSSMAQYKKEGWSSGNVDELWYISNSTYYPQQHLLYLYEMNCGDLETLANILLAFSKKFDRQQEIIAMAYSCSCSKPRDNEFGGGAFIVHRGRIRWMNTWHFIDKHRAKYKTKNSV